MSVWRAFICGLWSVAAVACAPEREAERWGVHTQAIVNGTVTPTLVPLSDGQITAIGWLYYTNTPDQAMCTGTVIGPRTVITARHCTRGQTPETLGFGVGFHPAQPMARFTLAEIHEHPGVDAAVLVLEEDPAQQVPSLVPLAINRSPVSAELLGSRLEGGGFGDTRDPTRTGRYFVTVLLSAIQADYLFTDGEGVQGLCHGDSGGPLMSAVGGAPTVMAVLHRGNSSCVDKDKLTRLDPITSWIDAVSGVGPGGACEGLDYFGACEGRTAVWCEGGEIKRRDCVADDGAVCGYVNPDLGFYCRPPSPCDDIPWGGMCDGEVLVLCDGAQRVEQDCSATGMFCTDITPAASCQEGAELSRLRSINTREVRFQGGCHASTSTSAPPWRWLLWGLLGGFLVRRRVRRG